MSERERIRRWRKRVYTRIQFAIGLILLAFVWLTLLPALWESDISRNAAAALTLWFIVAQGMALRWLWRWLSPYWRAASKEEAKPAK